jgi:hypothetical protein
MPYNLLKVYNIKLELDGLSVSERIESLKRIFNRDFVEDNLFFRGIPVYPTPNEGIDTMAVLFDHLTRKRNNDGSREYDRERSARLHWVRHHITERIPSKICVFSTLDKEGIRTYIHDKSESYVIILEPRTKLDFKHYYLLTAYYSTGRDVIKLKKKEKRKLSDIH